MAVNPTLVLKKEANMGKYVYQAIMTPDEDGGYSVEIPDLPGCFTCGDDFMDAAYMAADAGKTYIASLLLHGEAVPQATSREVPDECKDVYVFFETDESYIVQGEVISAAQAAREIGVSAGRVTHMLEAGLLDGYRNGRRTYVTVESVERRKAAPRAAGRPRKKAIEA